MELNLHCVLARSEERPNLWQLLRQVWTQTSSHISQLTWPCHQGTLSLYTRRVMSYYLLQYISLSRKSVESKRQSSSIELLINNIFRIPYVIIRDLINKHLATLIPTLRGTRRSKLKWRLILYFSPYLVITWSAAGCRLSHHIDLASLKGDRNRSPREYLESLKAGDQWSRRFQKV